jgi:hypothetical protein
MATPLLCDGLGVADPCGRPEVMDRKLAIISPAALWDVPDGRDDPARSRSSLFMATSGDAKRRVFKAMSTKILAFLSLRTTGLNAENSITIRGKAYLFIMQT